VTLPIRPSISPPAHVIHRYLAARELHDSRVARHVFAPGTRARAVTYDGAVEDLFQRDAWAMIDVSTSVPTYQRQRTLDQTKRLALIETYGEWPTHRMTELLLAVQTRASWQIVARAFARSRPAEPGFERDPIGEAQIRECLLAATDVTPAPREHTHLADCRYAFAGAGEPAFRHVTDSGWNAGRLGVISKNRMPVQIDISMRGSVAAAKIVRSDRSVRIVNHVLLLDTECTWKIADVSCSHPATGT